MILNIFIIGPSGSGKSTIGKLVAEKYHLTFFSISEVIKNEISTETGFGDEAKMYINDNKKVPDDLIFDILVNKLKSIDNQNFIVSGYPKTLNQGRLAEFYLRKQNSPCTMLINIDKPVEEPEDISSLKDYFETKSKFLQVDGTKPTEEVFEAIVKKIETLK